MPEHLLNIKHWWPSLDTLCVPRWASSPYTRPSCHHRHRLRVGLCGSWCRVHHHLWEGPHRGVGVKRGLFRNMQVTEQAGTQSMFPTGVEGRASGSRKSLCPSFASVADTSRPQGASKATQRGWPSDLKMKGGGVVKERGGVARAGLHHVHHGAPTAAFKEQPKICILIYYFLF